ncbi:MAG: GTPase Era [Calditrichia bacterium]|nr:GTPase Era [Calditrichia bacterium]
MQNNSQFKSGYIAIIGQPNVGKSTLMNNLLDVKLSITSPRPQTTRRRVMGILNKNDLQVIFLDTPGILTPKYSLQREMMNYVNLAISDADLLLYLIDGTLEEIKISDDMEKLVKINPSKKPVILAINKIDLFSKSILLPLMETIKTKYSFEDMIPISAKKNDGLDQLINLFNKFIPLHPPYYDPEVLTDQPERFFVTELIREQVFYQYQKEIPYSVEVMISEFKERKNAKNYISVEIFVERDSQKAIIIGKRGEMLKKLSTNSRKEIEKLLNSKIYLEIIVKVKKNWRQNSVTLKQFGY